MTSSTSLYIAVPRRRRRWLQFGLPALLGLVTLSAVGFAILAHPAQRAQRQQRAVEEIHRLGGSVAYKSTSGLPAWVREWVGEDYFRTVIGVDLANSRASDADLACLEGLTALEWVRLDAAPIRGAGFAHLRPLADLRWLSLRDTLVADADLAHLKRMTRLQSLTLVNTPVTAAGVATLRKSLQFTAIDGP